MVRRRHRGLAALVAGLIAAVLVLLLGAGTTTAAAADEKAAPACTVGTFVADTAAPKDPDAITGCIVRLENASSNTNAVSVDVVLTDKATSLPPAVSYGVFLTAHLVGKAPNGNPSPCQEAHFFTNPEYPRGVYRCSWLVDEPAPYVFEATVNKVGAGVVGIHKLLTVTATLNISEAVKSQCLDCGLKYVVTGRNFEVFLLQAHVAAASVWLLMVTVMTFLALPRLRRMCSVLTLHTLEVRRGFLTSVMWAMFLCVVGSGIYLLRTQTAYTAPFSTSAWHNITKLPYASTYFTALYAKIAVFVVMAAASVVLAQEAARQARLADDNGGPGGPGADDYDDDMWGHTLPSMGELPAVGAGDPAAGSAEGATAAGVSADAGRTAVAAAPRAKEPAAGVSARALVLAVLTIAGGMGAIGVCVTVIKYTHELIEQLVAYKTVNRG